MTADCFMTPSGCREYAASIASRVSPTPVDYRIGVRPKRPVRRRTAKEQLTISILLWLAILLERRQWQA